MAYPDIYAVTYSYIGFQARQGDNSFPGTELDADLAGLSDSIVNLSHFVKYVIRSDGALNNGIVTFDSLAPGLQLGGLAPADPWATGQDYFVNVVVVDNSKIYRCLVDHVAGVFTEDIAAGKWVFIGDLPRGADGKDGIDGVDGTNGVGVHPAGRRGKYLARCLARIMTSPGQILPATPRLSRSCVLAPGRMFAAWRAN